MLGYLILVEIAPLQSVRFLQLVMSLLALPVFVIGSVFAVLLDHDFLHIFIVPKEEEKNCRIHLKQIFFIVTETDELLT